MLLMIAFAECSGQQLHHFSVVKTIIVKFCLILMHDRFAVSSYRLCCGDVSQWICQVVETGEETRSQSSDV